MPLPKQVAAQAAAVEQYEKQVAEARTPVEPKPEDQTPADPPQEQRQDPPPAVATPPAKADDASVWEQRYRSLQGQYNSQVPDLQRQVRELTASVSTLTEQLRTQAEKAKPQEPSELVTKSDVETFGEDLVDLARRIARDEFGRRETKYQERIEALQEQLAEAKGQVGEVAQSQARSAQQVFFERLTAKLPNWEEVQATPECQAFLRSRIPGTAVTWNGALQQAGQNMDLDAVLEVFGAFFQAHPAQDPKAKQPAPQPNKDLAKQVAPGKSAASPMQSQKRVYSRDEFDAESNRYARLARSGQHDEARRIEQELDTALVEGRVRL